ncbi:formin-like protein 20 isoform X1 [Panicum virgatum]|uniref:Uncharacterized protein n=1 Tax=Panicum virgatum TaxID=38727 RepID=A0A8T0PK07_PANVG|nr:formin-like protein 20 isoform X1 [Panicum virgatum]XP_039776161.1 formin-like protein 20 isoform X1 [Panicum virgatum]KAG2560522.1 hypothetical protein PVAP13_8KG066052 [Panicum virgatum]
MILPHMKLFCLRDLLYPPDVPTLAIALTSSPSCMNPRSCSHLFLPLPLFLSFFASPPSGRGVHLPPPLAGEPRVRRPDDRLSVGPFASRLSRPGRRGLRPPAPPPTTANSTLRSQSPSATTPRSRTTLLKDAPRQDHASPRRISAAHSPQRPPPHPVGDGAREGHFLARFMPPLAGSPPPTCPTAAAAPRPRCRFSTQSPPRQGARTRRRPRLPAGVGRTRVHRSYNKQLPPASLACCGCRPCLFAPPHRRCVGPHSSEDVAAGGLPGRPRAPPPLHGRLPLRHSRKWILTTLMDTATKHHSHHEAAVGDKTGRRC